MSVKIIREKRTVVRFNLRGDDGTTTLGTILPDNFSGFVVHFDKSNLHSEKELGLTIMDRVTFICQPPSDACDFHLNKAKDVRLIDNG